MRLGNRTLAAAVLLLAALGGCDRIQSAMIERAAARNLGGDRSDLLDDGKLHVVLCGTGSPLADAERASACTAILAGGHFFLVDVGPGSSRNLSLWRLPRAKLDGVLLTHFHSDHIGELGETAMQSWVAGRTAPLAVYGPPGVEQVVDGFRRAYALDNTYRIAHHGAAALPPSGGEMVAHTVPIPAAGATSAVFDADGLRITAFAVDHAPVAPAFGYRVDYRGRSVVISGDTKKDANLVRQAQGADILVSEGLLASMIGKVRAYAAEHGLERWAKLTGDIVDYHTTPVQAAEEAKEAKVRMLVFTHIVPPLPNFLARRMFLSGVSSAFDGKVELGADGMSFELPAGSDAITVGSVN